MGIMIVIVCMINTILAPDFSFLGCGTTLLLSSFSLVGVPWFLPQLSKALSCLGMIVFFEGKREIWKLVSCVYFWCLWKERNKRIFIREGFCVEN